MQYDYIDEEAVASQFSGQRAKEAESRAYAAEYEVDRIQAQASLDTNLALTLDGAKKTAELLRKEADGWSAKAKLSSEDIDEVRRGVLTNLLMGIESMHKQAQIELDVRKMVGLPYADFTNQIEAHEKAWEVAQRKAKKLLRPKETTRTGAPKSGGDNKK